MQSRVEERQGEGRGAEKGLLVCHAGCCKGGGPVAQVDWLLGVGVPQHHSNPAPHAAPPHQPH